MSGITRATNTPHATPTCRLRRDCAAAVGHARRGAVRSNQRRRYRRCQTAGQPLRRFQSRSALPCHRTCRAPACRGLPPLLHRRGSTTSEWTQSTDHRSDRLEIRLWNTTVWRRILLNLGSLQGSKFKPVVNNVVKMKSGASCATKSDATNRCKNAAVAFERIAFVGA